MNEIIEHLKLIEGVISRLAKNSFSLKGWSITITTALFAFAGVRENVLFLYIGLIPIVFFWLLDSYYLWLEKKYRGLYDRVRVVETTDFDMSVKGISARFPIFTFSEWPFYIPQLVLVGLIICLTYLNGRCAS